MKLASLKHGRDGRLVVVSRDLTRMAAVPHIATSLQRALDDWEEASPGLEKTYQALNDGKLASDNSPIRPPAPVPCPAPINGPTGRPMSLMSNLCAGPAVPNCRKASGPIL